MLSITDLAVLESYIEEFKEDTPSILLPELLLTLNLTYLSDFEKAQIRELGTEYGYLIDYPSIPCKEGTMLMRLRRHTPLTQTYEFGALDINLRRNGCGALYMANWFNLSFLTNKCEIW